MNSKSVLRWRHQASYGAPTAIPIQGRAATVARVSGSTFINSQVSALSVYKNPSICIVFLVGDPAAYAQSTASVS